MLCFITRCMQCESRNVSHTSLSSFLARHQTCHYQSCYFINLIYQFDLQKLWDFKVNCLGHSLYLFCTMPTCLSFFRNASHANYLGKYTKGKNLIWVNRSFHESIFTWDSFDSNRYFLRAFKYFVLTLQFYKFMNVVMWVTWNCPITCKKFFQK